MLHVLYRTDPSVLARIVPRPLRPAEDARVHAMVARYPVTNFGCVYDEAALSVEVRWGRERGFYFLAMPVTDDTALIAGREVYGFPKKIAEQIELSRSGSAVVGSVTLTGPASADDLEPLEPKLRGGAGQPCHEMRVFNYKVIPAASGGLDALPRLVRAAVQCRPRPGLLRGTARVTVRSSPTDPLGEVPVLGEPLACTYGIWDNTLLRGRTVAKAWLPWRVLPHVLFRSDLVVQMLGPEPSPGASVRERRSGRG